MRSIVFAAVLLLATPALAQVDQRIAGPAVQALQAEVALRDAVIHALKEDQAKRDKDLADWFKGWFGEPKLDKRK